MDLQPMLTGASLTLRPLAADDWPALFAVASDPEIWAGHPAHDRWQEAVFRRFFDEALASGGALVAVDPTDGSLIGSSRFDTARAGPGEIEIGWTFLARSHWGGITNAAMKALMIGHALTGYERAIFLVGETNLRSRRALEKIGARLTPRRLSFDMATGPVKHLVYAIDRASVSLGPLAAVLADQADLGK
ncbi:acetyltransferase [alpha proteobacterium AAP81b]|nr:acetyltransferase [alpha proteobacterium AAP81b]